MRFRQIGLISCVILASCATPEVPVPEPDVGERVRRAEAARQADDLDTALEEYRVAHEAAPWNDRLKRTLAGVYTERAARRAAPGTRPALESAEIDLRAALSLYPADPELRRSLAIVLMEQSRSVMDPDRAAALRAEAEGLDREAAQAVELPESARVERRLDMAYALIERGQIDAASEDLERLLGEHPESVPVRLLLARTRVRHASDLAGHENWTAAGPLLDRAVELYAGLPDPAARAPGELEIAHRNRIAVWSRAGHPARAEAAREAARKAGVRLP